MLANRLILPNSDRCRTVNSRYLKEEVHHELLISQRKFSGSRKFTLRYQLFEVFRAECKEKSTCVQSIFINKVYFQVSVCNIQNQLYSAVAKFS